MDVFDIKKGVIRKYRYNSPDSTLIGPQMINRFISQQNGKLGFATSDGYFVLDSIAEKVKQILPLKGIDLNDVYLDRKGNYWAGSSENGLILVKTDGAVEKFDESSGFPSNSISGSLEDTKGNIWVLTSSGLAEYQVETRQFRHFNFSNGLQGRQFTSYARLKARDGTFYIGGFNGFNVFRPEDIQVSSYLPPVYIDEFRIFNEPVKIDSLHSLLKQSISNTKEIVLTYKQSVFSFGFSAVNFTYPENALYAYKMVGYDEKWTYTDASRRYVSYTNLDPGAYTFQVKATNNDGVWNETPTTIDVTITPPFWETWWFKILSALLIIGSVFGFYLIRINQLKRQKRVLEKAVWDRTTKLRQVNNELEISREEVIIKNEAIEKQNIELDIANQTKNKLFSIVAHDLKNPFNTILGFINILIDSYDELNEEEKRNFLTIIQGSSQTAYNLVENLLNWARTQTNSIILNSQEINVKDMIGTNVELVKIFGEAKSIDIVFDEVDAFHTIYADKTMIDTVLRNILTNAIKFSKKGSSVQIISNQRRDFVYISIKDQGVGMNNEQIEKLFQIGGNSSTQGTSGETGTGLGIIICKEFVERNKGDIKVSSMVGEGTTFEITLPSAVTGNI